MRSALPLAALLMSGCGAFGNPKPVIENRFAALDPAGMADRDAVRISVTTTAVTEPAGGVPLVALGDRAQAALIVATNGKPPAKVGRPKPDAPGAIEIVDEVTRHFDVTIRPTDFLPPGDRVDGIRVSLEVAPVHAATWRIAGWSQASNGQKTIELGKLTDVSESKFSASTGLKIAGFLPDATISGESSRSATREATLRDTTDFDAGVDEDGRAWLDESGGWRENLAHNLAMDATVVARAGIGSTPRHYVSASDLRGEDGSPVPAGKVRLADVTFYEPPGSDQPICGVARLVYRIRHIVTGAATLTESDDRISFRTGSHTAGFLLSVAPYRPLYALAAGGHFLAYRPTGGATAALRFASLEEATAFRNWLRAIAGTRAVANATIGIAAASGALRPVAAAELAVLVPTLSPEAVAVRARRADASRCGLAAADKPGVIAPGTIDGGS